MSAKHLALQVELPAVYTADIEGLREFQGDATESEFLLNCVGEPSVVRVRMEVSGEKDSSVVEVWGHIRDAKLVEPSRGYGPGTALTDEQLAENGVRLLRDERGCEWCQVPGDAPEDAPPETDAVHPFALVDESTEPRNRHWLAAGSAVGVGAEQRQAQPYPHR